MPKTFDATDFIRTRLPLTQVPGLAGVMIHLANPHSGLGRLPGRDAAPPYWAYLWAGGMALASHLRANPGIVAGKRVLDLGAGSGLVGIVAAQAGAATVTAAEIDPMGQIAVPLNAAANDVRIDVIANDLLAEPDKRPAVDVILVGDLFYDAHLADRVIGFLDTCRNSGVEILVGDPGRASLPRSRLRLVAEYPVRDMGDTKDRPAASGQVFRLS